MGFAAVDIGNTSIKYCIWGSESVSTSNIASIRALGRLFAKDGVDEVAYCSTRRLSAEEEKLVAADGWWELTPERSLPITLRYDTPSTLGRDRLAAAVGAAALYPGRCLLIADVGTALTLDVVSAGSVFLGGNISPGLEMRAKALHDCTSMLPKVDPLPCKGLLGHDTMSAIQHGVIWGVASEIAGTFRLARKQTGCEKILLSGGGAELIKNNLEELLEGGDCVESFPAIVEEGLKIAYEYNHEE